MKKNQQTFKFFKVYNLVIIEFSPQQQQQQQQKQRRAQKQL